MPKLSIVVNKGFVQGHLIRYIQIVWGVVVGFHWGLFIISLFVEREGEKREHVNCVIRKYWERLTQLLYRNLDWVFCCKYHFQEGTNLRNATIKHNGMTFNDSIT